MTGVLVSHENMVSEIFLTSRQDRQYWDAQPPWPKRTLAHLPAAHIAGVVNYFASQVVSGATTYWMPKFEFGAFVEYVKTLQITTFFTVPPIYLAIAKHPSVKEQFWHVRQAMVGAAPVSAELRAEANKKMPGLVIGQVWGMSETTGAATYTALNSQEQAGSLGPLLPNLSVRYSFFCAFDVHSRMGCPAECAANGGLVLLMMTETTCARASPARFSLKDPLSRRATTGIRKPTRRHLQRTAG